MQLNTLGYRLLYKWTMQGKLPSVTTDPNTLQNYSKFIDLVIRIELTQKTVIQRISNVPRNSIIHFRILFISSIMFSESNGFVVVSVTSCIKERCSNLSLSN